MINSNIFDFRYHSTCENNGFLFNPDPFHQGGVNNATDFGAGLYLSDDYYSSLIWGSRNTYPDRGTLNVYDISPSITELPGLIIGNTYEDILSWALTTGKYLGYNARNIASANAGALDTKYLIDCSQYHWILSRRTDDRMYSYLDYFFNGSLSFLGLVECFDNLSFGDELVIKTPDAMKCISHNAYESEVFDKAPYVGKYKQATNDANDMFDDIFARHAVAFVEEIGVEEIVQLIENGKDWTQYV